MTAPILLKADAVDKNRLPFSYPTALNTCASFTMTFVSFKLLFSFCIGEIYTMVALEPATSIKTYTLQINNSIS